MFASLTATNYYTSKTVHTERELLQAPVNMYNVHCMYVCVLCIHLSLQLKTTTDTNEFCRCVDRMFMGAF